MDDLYGKKAQKYKLKYLKLKNDLEGGLGEIQIPQYAMGQPPGIQQYAMAPGISGMQGMQGMQGPGMVMSGMPYSQEMPPQQMQHGMQGPGIVMSGIQGIQGMQGPAMQQQYAPAMQQQHALGVQMTPEMSSRMQMSPQQYAQYAPTMQQQYAPAMQQQHALGAGMAPRQQYVTGQQHALGMQTGQAGMAPQYTAEALTAEALMHLQLLSCDQNEYNNIIGHNNPALIQEYKTLCSLKSTHLGIPNQQLQQQHQTHAMYKQQPAGTHNQQKRGNIRIPNQQRQGHCTPAEFAEFKNNPSNNPYIQEYLNNCIKYNDEQKNGITPDMLMGIKTKNVPLTPQPQAAQTAPPAASGAPQVTSLSTNYLSLPYSAPRAPAPRAPAPTTTHAAPQPPSAAKVKGPTVARAPQQTTDREELWKNYDDLLKAHRAQPPPPAGAIVQQAQAQAQAQAAWEHMQRITLAQPVPSFTIPLNGQKITAGRTAGSKIQTAPHAATSARSSEEMQIMREMRIKALDTANLRQQGQAASASAATLAPRGTGVPTRVRAPRAPTTPADVALVQARRQTRRQESTGAADVFYDAEESHGGYLNSTTSEEDDN